MRDDDEAAGPEMRFPDMDPATLREHLALAEAHIAQGLEHIRRQHQVIADLAKDGHDTTRANELLAVLESTQEMHVASKERILAELDNEGSETDGA